MSTHPISSTNPPTSALESGDDDPFRSQALKFWRAFAQSDSRGCREVLKLLQEWGVGGGDAFSFAESPLSASGETLGKYVKVELPGTSPRNAADAWNIDKETNLLRVDPKRHCLAIDGAAGKFQGGDYFVACASPAGHSRSPDSCNVQTHLQKDRKKVELDGPAYLVKVRPSSQATKPKVLAGVSLMEDEIPSVLWNQDENILLTLSARPAVWKYLIEEYPGYGEILKITAESGTDVDDLLAEADRLLNIPGAGDRGRGSLVSSVDEEEEQFYNAPPMMERSVPAELDTQMLEAFTRRGTIGTRLAHRGPHGGGGRTLPSRFAGSGDSIGSVPRSIASAPTARDGGEWRSAIRKLERRLDTEKRELKIKFSGLDQTLDRDFDYVENELTRIAADAAVALQEAREAKATLDQLNIEGSIQAHLTNMGTRGSFQNGGRSVTPPPTFHWSNLSQAEQADLLAGIIAGLNKAGYAQAVGNTLGLRKITETVREVEGRLMDVEREFSQDQGIVSRLQQSVAGIEARRNVSACERAGYIFNGPEDVEAMIQVLPKKGLIFPKCLDLIGLLTLAQDPYVTYAEGIKVHADAIKANFDGVGESRIKLSFEIPYPEIIVKCIENAGTAARGGAKWAPMFASAEVFEDDFRDGAHRRVVNGIERAYELVQKSVDRAFPISQRGSETADLRKIHTILTEQNRLAHRQTIAFIECLLPFYRTLKVGSLTSEESWDRVLVFVLEVLTALQEHRVLACADVSDEAGMIWGCFKATDFGEEFRKQKFVEHHKALAILALTSIEREGKAMSLLEERMKKVFEASKNEKYAKLETRIQTVENWKKNLVTKNPDLK